MFAFVAFDFLCSIFFQNAIVRHLNVLRNISEIIVHEILEYVHNPLKFLSNITKVRHRKKCLLFLTKIHNCAYIKSSFEKYDETFQYFIALVYFIFVFYHLSIYLSVRINSQKHAKINQSSSTMIGNCSIRDNTKLSHKLWYLECSRVPIRVRVYSLFARILYSRHTPHGAARHTYCIRPVMRWRRKNLQIANEQELSLSFKSSIFLAEKKV